MIDEIKTPITKMTLKIRRDYDLELLKTRLSQIRSAKRDDRSSSRIERKTTMTSILNGSNSSHTAFPPAVNLGKALGTSNT